MSVALGSSLLGCGDIEPAHVGGSLHKARAKPAPSAKVRPGAPSGTKAKTKGLDRAFDIEEMRPAETKNLDRAFDIEESKAKTQGLDRAFDIEEMRPAETKNLDRAFDIEESRAARNNGALRPQTGPGARPGPQGKPLIGEDANQPLIGEDGKRQ